MTKFYQEYERSKAICNTIKQSKIEETNLTCVTCEMSFICTLSLKKHRTYLHKEIKFTCHQCNKEFSQKGNLKTHVQSVHEKTRHQCNLCDQSFTLEQSLKIHFEKVHEGITTNAKLVMNYSKLGKL